MGGRTVCLDLTYSFNICEVQCDSSLRATRQIELAMHCAMLKIMCRSRLWNFETLMKIFIQNLFCKVIYLEQPRSHYVNFNEILIKIIVSSLQSHWIFTLEAVAFLSLIDFFSCLFLFA